MEENQAEIYAFLLCIGWIWAQIGGALILLFASSLRPSALYVKRPATLGFEDFGRCWLAQ